MANHFLQMVGYQLDDDSKSLNKKKVKCLEITIAGFGVPGVFFYTPQVFQGLFPFFAHVWNIYSLWPICTEAQLLFSEEDFVTNSGGEPPSYSITLEEGVPGLHLQKKSWFCQLGNQK